MRHIGRILRAVREARGLSPEAVAGHLGYGSDRKARHRLAVIEGTGRVKDEVLVRLLEVLSLDPATFEDLTESLYLTGRMPPIPPTTVGA